MLQLTKKHAILSLSLSNRCYQTAPNIKGSRTEVWWVLFLLSKYINTFNG